MLDIPVFHHTSRFIYCTYLDLIVHNYLCLTQLSSNALSVCHCTLRPHTILRLLGHQTIALSDMTDLPTSIHLWKTAVSRIYNTPNALGLSLDDVQKLPSASKLEEADWLLLRILSPKAGKTPSQVDLFGKQLGHQMQVKSQNFIRKQPWGEAFDQSSENLAEWSTMALWKRSA